jgi:hypothetical protein
MSRFKVGQKVRITGPMAKNRRDVEAIVLKVKGSPYSTSRPASLDKYVVRFSDGDQDEFYEMQLMSVVSPEMACAQYRAAPAD